MARSGILPFALLILSLLGTYVQCLPTQPLRPSQLDKVLTSLDALMSLNTTLFPELAAELPKISWHPCDLSVLQSIAAIQEPIDCARVKTRLGNAASASQETLDLRLVRIRGTQVPIEGSFLFSPKRGTSGTRITVEDGGLFEYRK